MQGCVFNYKGGKKKTKQNKRNPIKRGGELYYVCENFTNYENWPFIIQASQSALFDIHSLGLLIHSVLAYHY
jgi:hypothetical protein